MKTRLFRSATLALLVALVAPATGEENPCGDLPAWEQLWEQNIGAYKVAMRKSWDSAMCSDTPNDILFCAAVMAGRLAQEQHENANMRPVFLAARDAAYQGSVPAMVWVANLWLSGEGTTQDINEAEIWWRVARVHGWRGADFYLNVTERTDEQAECRLFMASLFMSLLNPAAIETPLIEAQIDELKHDRDRIHAETKKRLQMIDANIAKQHGEEWETLLKTRTTKWEVDKREWEAVIAARKTEQKASE